MESQIDTQVALNAIESYTSGITSYFTQAMPLVVSLLMLSLVVLLIWLGYKWFRRGVLSEDEAKTQFYHENRNRIEEEYGS